MVFERRRHTPHSLNLTPLVDVVFLLLFFFMLTGSFINRSAVDLKLPKAGAHGPDKETAAVLTIDRDGRIYLEDQVVDLETLPNLLRARFEGTQKKEVMIRADRRADFGPVVRVMDAAAEAGAEGVAVATKVERNSE